MMRHRFIRPERELRMSTQRPLNAIAIDVVGQYNDAAKHLVCGVYMVTNL